MFSAEGLLNKLTTEHKTHMKCSSVLNDNITHEVTISCLTRDFVNVEQQEFMIHLTYYQHIKPWQIMY